MKLLTLTFTLASVAILTSCTIPSQNKLDIPAKTLCQNSEILHLETVNNRYIKSDKIAVSFNLTTMNMNGFDGCNEIYGKIYKNHNTYIIPKILSTNLKCKSKKLRDISRQIHTSFKNTFTLENASLESMKGKLLTSNNYKLFFKNNASTQEKIVPFKSKITSSIKELLSSKTSVNELESDKKKVDLLKNKNTSQKSNFSSLPVLNELPNLNDLPKLN